jgi:shikimate dehydrogenase
VLKEFNLKQDIVGCFAFPVAENLRQRMIEPAFRAIGLDWRYLTLEVRPKNLAAAVAGARAFGFHGFNCAVPHKVAIIQHLDGLGESASLIGAVNCVVNRGGQFIGENTEGKGLVANIRQLVNPRGKSLVLLGVNGAARAIGVEMALAGCRKITLVNHDESCGRELETLFGGALRKTVQASGRDLAVNFTPWRKNVRVPADTEILVDTTSEGLFPGGDSCTPLTIETISPQTIVADVIPNPPPTRLASKARAKGCSVIDGFAMLVQQAMINVEYWTGRTPEAVAIRQAWLTATRAASDPDHAVCRPVVRPGFARRRCD